MNINDEEIDLRLALGSRSYGEKTRLNGSSSGAGVNANSRTGMPFAASDPLSELVWSPHNGLSLICADSSLADNRHFFTGNLGESMKEILRTSMSVRSKGSGDIKVSDEAKLNVTPKMHGGGSFSFDLDARWKNCDAGRMEEGGTTDSIQENIEKGDAGDDLGISLKMQIADIAGSSKTNAEQDILADRKLNTAVNWKMPSKLMRGTLFDRECRLKTDASRSDFIRYNHQTAKASEALVCSLPNPKSQQEPGEEVTSASGNVHKNKPKASISIPPLDFTRLESSAENDMGHLAAIWALTTENALGGGRGKGKEKASSDGDMYGKMSNDDEDDSHESVESCNSAGLLSRGIKRRHVGQGQLIGSKRMREKIEGSHGSTSFIKPDSSFTNWISNMVKGFSDSNQKEHSPLPLTLAHYSKESFTCNKTDDCTKPVMGFRSVFNSLICRSTNEKTLENLPETFDGNNFNSCKQIVLSNKEVNPHISVNDSGKGEVSPSDSFCEKANCAADKTSVDIPLPGSCLPVKSSPLSSLWITRLYTRASRLGNCSSDSPNANLDNQANDVLLNDQKISEAREDCGGDDVRSSEHKVQSFSPKMTPVQLSEELRSSEAMASVFAKRLDALRYIIHPPEKKKSLSCQLICFFCGSSGHDLRICPELTEAELENLLVKISSLDTVEESHCLCIRCFQLDHWAIECPLVSSDDHKQVVSKPVASSKKPIFSSFPDDPTQDVKESSRKRLSFSNEFPKSTSSSSEHRLNGKQVLSPRWFIKSYHAIQKEEVFHAIRKLRLSRADILRWMDFNASLSHLNGFFLRLRLGKVNGGPGTTYYVSCITGDTIEKINCKSSKSILVDVGGIKSTVGSQYISNHDFLEDEINAWWGRIVRTSGKIPSLDELKSKIEDRELLGL